MVSLKGSASASPRTKVEASAAPGVDESPRRPKPRTASGMLPKVPPQATGTEEDASPCLDPFFAPKSVAVIGATEKPNSVGRTILWNLISHSFGGTVYPINPNRPSVLGIRAYPRIADVPERVELAVVVTPAATVLGVIEECGRAGVRSAVIISAGFKEIGEKGVALEQQILSAARGFGMRLVGPNCLGVMCPVSGLNATFASTIARPGSVGFISQSGALCTSILDWSLKQNLGFSAFISMGSMLDVDWGDLILYLGDDPRTKSILIYMESVGNASSFLSAAREVALRKPIIVIKPGRTEAAIKAASTHTGSLAGSDEVLNAAFRRVGVLRVDNIEDLFLMADVVGKQPRPKGPRLTIVTNAGGPGVLATDALITNGGALTELSAESIKGLNELLPPHWSHGNPIDILGDATAERYAKALEIAVKDPQTDGVLMILSPQAMTDATRAAEAVKEIAQNAGKPVLASWMGAVEIARGEEILNRAQIPTFPYPDTAVRMFNYLWKYSYNLKGLYQTPTLPLRVGKIQPARRATEFLAKIRKSGRELLTEHEAKQVLAMYGIPTIETRLAASPVEAQRIAKELGYPVVLKLNSHTVTHKTEVNGIQLDLHTPLQVKKAFQAIQASVKEKAGASAFQGVTVQRMVKAKGYELILGSSLDTQFGPVLLFGMGGQLVEVFRDSSLGLPPLNTTLATRMMEQTKIYHALKGVRGRKPVNLDQLDDILVLFSQLVAEQPWIKEIDINPLLATPEGCWALDARIVQHPASTREADLPKLAIRPYPSQYSWSSTLDNGTPFNLRPIRPEDEPQMVKFHATLSERTVYHRYLSALQLSQRIDHERLARICFIDYDCELALVAEQRCGPGEGYEILGVARLNKYRHSATAEFAVLIGDQYQQRGLGTEMLSRLLEIAKVEGLRKVVGFILPDNEGMQQVCRKLGFKLSHLREDRLIKAEISID